MKRFLKSFALFMIPIIAFAVIVESILRFSPNDYNYKSNYMSEHASEIECLILGNSHSAWGIAPNYFPFKTFNLAFAGQPLIFDELLLEKYINKMTSLKYVILSTSYCVPYYDFEHDENDVSTRIYPIYFDIYPDYDEWKYHFEITASHPRIILSRLANMLSSTELRCLEYGNYTEQCLSDTIQLSNLAALKHNDFYRRVCDSLPVIYEKNVGALKKMVNLCEEKAIHLFLVIPPHTVSYLNNLNPQMKNETLSLLQDISQSSNVCVLNYSNDIRFLDNRNFSDEDHLCQQGSEKFSKILNDTIQKFCARLIVVQ